MNPSFSEFKRLAEQGNLIPFYREFLADTETPVSAYLKIKDKSYSYLLESAEGGKRWGRYSFIGYKPLLVAASLGQRMEITEGSKKKILEDVGNPLHVLRDLIKQFEPVTIDGLSPFQGGFVGYVNYDLVRNWEYLPGISPDLTGMPESLFTFSGRLIIFDHLTHRIQAVTFAHVRESGDLYAVYEQAAQEIDETIGELQRPLSHIPENNTYSVSHLEPNFHREGFEEAVRKAKDHIIGGDVIQVVLSQRFSGDVVGDDFMLYRNLRSINPSPYMFYLNFGETKFIGSSPEILARLNRGRIELRPIAGTRPRGKTPEEDLNLERELMADPKERAEHIMLVDLGRNDVGKVAMPGSVSVPQFMDVERYSHVMHIVSSVEGLLKSDMDGFDLFMAAFPAGTVSGAPKIRAMEIISDLEPTTRGPYAGAVGYFGFNGDMDFCITIRTITITDSRLSIQVGAGIVADSSPEGEYEETLRKAAAMFKAIERGNPR
ncbi:MAG: anthranilate synthase component I [Deltaproteobacteria bacterium]|nr:anthranilate synthase component I [Deltaproteobacteria bacterium]